MIKHLLILAPIFPPSPGGAAQYLQFLARELSESGDIGTTEVVTERLWRQRRAFEKHGRAEIKRVLTQFNGLPCRMKRRYAAWLLQNIQLAWHCVMRAIRLRGNGLVVVVVHGAFLIHPTLLIAVTRCVKRIMGTDVKFVLDLRDRSAPMRRLARLGHFDHVISCSRNITARISCCWEAHPPLTEIPVPLERRVITDQDVGRTLAKHSLRREGYVFTANGIVQTKGFGLIYAAWLLLVASRDLDLAVAGPVRDWRHEYGQRTLERPGLRVLGSASNDEIRALMKGAAVVVNPSRVEGLPRSCLEALSVGAPTLLPPGVPEFGDLDSRFVASSDDPAVIARQVAWLISERRVARYDIDVHDGTKVAEKYRAILRTMTAAP